MNQLIYRLDKENISELDDMHGFPFIEYRTWIDAFRYSGLLIRHRGIFGFLKDIAKLVTPRRAYYCISDGKKIVSEAYVTIGKCKHYKIEDNAAVVGPVWTDANIRGKGLATGLLKRVINSLVGNGCNSIYIDTSERNLAMQKVIKNCGFKEGSK